jgi:hypothetical protein
MSANNPNLTIARSSSRVDFSMRLPGASVNKTDRMGRIKNFDQIPKRPAQNCRCVHSNLQSRDREGAGHCRFFNRLLKVIPKFGEAFNLQKSGARGCSQFLML